jgi:hypothetical protein
MIRDRAFLFALLVFSLLGFFTVQVAMTKSHQLGRNLHELTLEGKEGLTPRA